MKRLIDQEIIAILLLSSLIELSWPAISKGQAPSLLQFFDKAKLENIWLKAATSFEDEGRPPAQKRAAGGSRLACESSIVALVPGTDVIETTKQGCIQAKSSDALPTKSSVNKPLLWFYTQTSSTTLRRKAQIALLNQSGELIAIEELFLPEESGIFSVLLPQTLEENKIYQWSLSVIEDPKQPAKNPFVQGWIRWNQQQQPSLPGTSTPVRSNLARQRAVDFARMGFWNDALTSLAYVQQNGSQDMGVREDWGILLSSGGLNDFTKETILPCCVKEIDE